MRFFITSLVKVACALPLFKYKFRQCVPTFYSFSAEHSRQNYLCEIEILTKTNEYTHYCNLGFSLVISPFHTLFFFTLNLMHVSKLDAVVVKCAGNCF